MSQTIVGERVNGDRTEPMPMAMLIGRVTKERRVRIRPRPHWLGLSALASFTAAGFLVNSVVGFVVLGVCLVAAELRITA